MMNQQREAGRGLRRLATAATAVLLSLGVTGPVAGQEGVGTRVDELTVSVSGGTVAVSGRATFVEGPVALAEDAAGDPMVQEVGADLGKATATATIGPGGPSLTMAVTILDHPSVTHPVTEALIYRWYVFTNNPGFPYGALEAVRNGVLAHPASASPAFRYFRTSGCPAPVLCMVSGTLTGRILPDRVEWTLPASLTGPGSWIKHASLQAGLGGATVDASSPYLVSLDTHAGSTSYEFPAPSVSLGIAPAGTPAEQVPLTGTATVGSDGAFGGELAVAGQAGSEQVVVAKACFGEGPCSLSSAAVTI